MSSINVALLWSDDNLKRAWRWVRSNPDAQYKGYFREMYSAWATADEDLLTDLQQRLARGIYEPTEACKLYLPKPSGVLRPYSLLNLEDQIVYQAAVNIIAERLFPRVKHRYYKEVFGHLYAGKNSVWFYRKWTTGYSRFNEAAHEAYRKGFRQAATFDITACYDSLDHSVLKHFLKQLRLGDDFCQCLTDWLSVWTATSSGIIHNHGIPQGPLPSGMLAETVLQYFDKKRGRKKTVRYLRYVDDIRLYAADKEILRSTLVRLDRLSKDIGLFPQSSKIKIREVRNIEEELKSVSRPPEASIKPSRIDQKALRKRIKKLTPRYDVKNPTRFKFLLAHAMPNAELTERLWRIYEQYPEYYLSIARYYGRYYHIPGKAATRILKEISEHKLYPSVVAEFINAILGRIRSTQEAEADRLIQKLWKPSTLEPDLLIAVARWLIGRGKLTYAQLQYVCSRTKSWWPRAQLALALTGRFIGQPSLESLLARLLADESSDVAIITAYCYADFGKSLSHTESASINPAAIHVLKCLGLVTSDAPSPCGIELSFSRIAGRIPKVDWRTLFGSEYREAERQAVRCRAYADTNATSFVNAMDVWSDWLLASLYRHRPSMGTYRMGTIGSVMNSPRLKKAFPSVQSFVKDIHEKRYQSHLSHARERKTGKPTGYIRYTYVRTARRFLRAALQDLASEFPPSPNP